MSNKTVIDFEAISIECQSICEVASKQLCQIDTLLQKIDESSQLLQGHETLGMKRQLQERAAKIKSRIDKIVKQADTLGKRGRVNINDSDLVRIARSVSAEVNSITTIEIANYEALLNNLLDKKVSEHHRDMRLRASGTVAHNAEFNSALATVTDEALKGFIYIEWLDNSNANKNFEELKSLAVNKMKDGAENYFKTERKKIISEIQSEMRAAKIDETAIKAAITSKITDVKEQIEDIRNKATVELVGEAIRKKTLKIIINCIESKGFIVDRKNIKLQKEKNEVFVLAQKASGECAEFRIMLDGKFIYCFDGYEGQACQNDIEPFMQDLANIYGIKVTGAQEIWSNPDKISTQKYQQIKTLSNKE